MHMLFQVPCPFAHQVRELGLLLEEQQNAKEAAREELRQERLASKRTAERAHTNHMRHMQAHAAELAELQVGRPAGLWHTHCASSKAGCLCWKCVGCVAAFNSQREGAFLCRPKMDSWQRAAAGWNVRNGPCRISVPACKRVRSLCRQPSALWSSC